jgi:putative transposase
MQERYAMIDYSADLSIRKQASILGLQRSKLYYKPIINADSEIANLIREVYLGSDCRYGYRKITAALRQGGQVVNNKKVLKTMQEIGIEGLYPKRNVKTTIAAKEHKIYPYLLKDLEINRVNQVWATDITYIRMNGYFMYFIAIIDLHSRYILSYNLSNSLEAGFCLSTLKEALSSAKPEIFNSDQGCQFTSNDFVNELEIQFIKISMDHAGRCFDNIFIERLWRTLKQEVIYYYRPETIQELEKYLQDFVLWYNNHRLHQSLKYKTPASVYFTE